MTIRILLVDDQQLVRAGFRSILERQADLEVVGEAADGAQALRLVDTTRPHLVLMDIRMPVMDGLTATRHIMEQTDPPAVIVLTTFNADELVYRALREGASGFLLKDTSPEELVASVHAVVSGDQILSPQITRQVIAAYVAAPDPLARETVTRRLSEREVEVLLLVARGKSNLEIAGTLFIAETTVKTNVARMLQKLELRDRIQAVVLAYELGLVRPRQ